MVNQFIQACIDSKYNIYGGKVAIRRMIIGRMMIRQMIFRRMTFRRMMFPRMTFCRKILHVSPKILLGLEDNNNAQLRCKYEVLSI
jgi:hypothetical protein